MKTKAAVLYSLNQPLVIEEIEIPALALGQVLVQMAWSGLCRSQINEIQGRKGEDKFLPHVLGHEGSGVVADIGPDVVKVKPGDRVVLTWIKGQGHDVPSALYRKNDTVINSGAISTFSDYTVVSENRLVPIPHNMPLDTAALLGCAVQTGGGIVRNTLAAKEGTSIAVFGVGGIGMSALLTSSALSCKPIIAVDIHDEKLAYASKLGAHICVNAKKENPVERILEITNKKGADCALEATGVKNAMEQAFASVRGGGGLLVIAGNLTAGEKISIDPFDLIKGKRIIGSWGGDAHPDQDIPWYIEHYMQKKLPLDTLITHRFSLDEINRAIETLENEKNVIRVLIQLGT